MARYEPMRPAGFQQITSLSSAVSLTVPDNATRAVFKAATNDVWWRDDGTAPTAGIGMHLPKDTYYEYNGELSKIQFIEATASAALNISYYK